MYSRPPEPLKRIAAHVAGIISSGQSGDSQELIREVLAYARKKTEDQHRVGVWRSENLHSKIQYVRDMHLASEWSLWDDMHTIPPKTEACRVAFLGESAARGFLYAPYYTPAQILEECLNTMQDSLEGEVVDLSRTNQGMAGLVKTILASLVLEPDALVIFAGNNWFSSNLLTTADFDLLSRQTGVSNYIMDVRHLLEKKVKDMVGRLLKYVADISSICSIPVVMVIPEYNLVDNKSTEHENVISRLEKEEILSWLATKERAEAALAKADFAEAEALAQHLLSIDASHPAGYELLGQCQLKQGFTVEARKNLEAARDTALYMRSISKPRILSVIRETILTQSQEYGITVVDLQAEFDLYSGGKLPGKELFLDYCHLTAKGIQIAMAATANRLLPLLGVQAVEGAPPQVGEPTDEVAGMAHLFAAIHNAHYGQPSEVVQHHCREAVRLSKNAGNFMCAFVEMATRYAPNSICRIFEELVNINEVEQYFSAFQHPRDGKLMDVELVSVMVDTLKAQGIDCEQEVNQLRKQEHSVTRWPVNLLNTFYSSRTYESNFDQGYTYLLARQPKSAFYLVSEANIPVTLNIAYRVPQLETEEAFVTILVNNHPVTRLPASPRWLTAAFEVSSGLVRDGINELTVQWPVCQPCSKEGSDDFSLPEPQDFARKIYPGMYALFGEIQTFTAVTGA